MPQAGISQTPGHREIERLSIAILPDGLHLPPGAGDAKAGKAVYLAKCTACHGSDLKGMKSTGGPALVGGRGSLATGHAVTRSRGQDRGKLLAMQHHDLRLCSAHDAVQRPESLSDNEVYAVVAYILDQGDIIGDTDVMNAKTLAKVKMPNRDGFIPDARPNTRNYN